MGLFDRLQKKKQEDRLSEKAIWEMENTNEFLIAMFDLVSKKSQYGADIGALNEEEKIFLITQQVETEVNNGGFSQYFYNSSGDMANEMVHAFAEIGADKTAEICRKALAAYGSRLPVDGEERAELLDQLDSDAVDRTLEECDAAFFEYAEDLHALNYAYIMEYKNCFT